MHVSRLMAAVAIGALVAACGEPAEEPRDPVEAARDDDEAVMETPVTEEEEIEVVEPAAQDLYWDNLMTLCGNAYAGEMTDGGESARANFGDQTLIMHARECSDSEIKIPFHVGENRSRTWVFTRTEDGLRLKHDHRHEDGSEDDITMYGGDTTSDGTENVQSFPADAFSIQMFAEHAEHEPGLVGAENNVWTVEIWPGTMFAYQLHRTHEPDRRFRVEFDLTETVDAPPAPWGHE
jgi:hypothetical protein